MGCGCKDDQEPVSDAIRENVVLSDSDLESKVRLLESELQMWKDSFNELSEEYVSLLGEESDGLIPPTNNNEDNGWSGQAPSLREVDIVAEVRLKVLTSKPQIETCDVFDVLKVDFIDDVEDMTLADMVYGVTKIDGVVIPEDD
jgi:hypothetical protein